MLPAIVEDEHVNCACPASSVYWKTMVIMSVVRIMGLYLGANVEIKPSASVAHLYDCVPTRVRPN